MSVDEAADAASGDKQHRRIPANCKACGEPLDRPSMELWLDACSALGVDPVEKAFGVEPPGIHCLACVSTRIAELIEGGDPAALRFRTKARAARLGLRVAK